MVNVKKNITLSYPQKHLDFLMEESSGVQCEENKTVPEKNRSRQFKSQEQLQGLEDFYNEHKYPTESLKLDIAIKLNLTERQVSGWLCHRRLKDKRAEELKTFRKPDLSSGVVQDHASGLKQESCSSTKQANHKFTDPREVESRRYSHNNLPAVELNYPQRGPRGGTEMDVTSSESNSDREESFYPQNRSNLMPVKTTDHRASNGFSQHGRRVGPSGYLKIKGQTENAAITAVKRQLGRHYRDDGPSLGIEFDLLPPEAFESPNKNINEDVYGDVEPFAVSPHDVSRGICKHPGLPGLSTMRNEKLYASEDMYLHKSNPDNITFRQPKTRLPFPNHSRGFPDQKSSFGTDSFSAQELSFHNNSRNLSIQRKHDLPGIRSDARSKFPTPSGRENVSGMKDIYLPDNDNFKPKVPLQREVFSSKPTAVGARHTDFIYKEDRLPSNRIIKNNEEFYAGRRPTSEHNDLVKPKMHPPNELRANKRGREEILEEEYPIRTSSQDRALWSKQIKGPTEMPSSFSEDETAETSSSMEWGL